MRAAADLEHPGALGEGDVAQVRPAHRLLLGVGGAQLQHLGDPGDEGRRR
jgi:hypothetical protein